MIILSGKGILPPASTGQPNQGRSAPASPRETAAERNFDQISISAREGEDAFQMELKSRISREVRTVTTTGAVSALRRQFEAGEYRIDAAAIARKILLLEEA